MLPPEDGEDSVVPPEVLRVAEGVGEKVGVGVGLTPPSPLELGVGVGVSTSNMGEESEFYASRLETFDEGRNFPNSEI